MAKRPGHEAHSIQSNGRRPALERRLCYTFARPELLELALTHRSSVYEANGVDPHSSRGERRAGTVAGTDNEQLEFLGDAVLGLAVAEALYRAFPGSHEGDLTRLRASLVSRKHMTAVGDALGLRDELVLGRSAELSGVRRKPTLLANAAEAVIGAVYLDGGFEAARALIDRAIIDPQMASLREALATGAAGGVLRDHKTLLQERVQATGVGRLRYIDAGHTGPPHQRRFCVEAQLEGADGTRVLASAEGGSKKEAQQRAAELALEGWAAALERIGRDTSDSESAA